MSDQQLAEELHNPIIRKFEKRKVHSSFLYKIWGANLTDIQLLSKCNKGIRFLLYVSDTFSKYTWVILLKDKKRIEITNAFQKVLKESNRKPNKMWVDKDSEFYNRSTKSWLEKMLQKCIQYIMKQNMYIDKLDDIVNKCNNRYYRTIKIKPVDVKLSTYIDSN